MAGIIHDCEAEDSIHRDPRGMNKIAKDILKSTPKKIGQKLTDEMIYKRYQELYEIKHEGKMPPDFRVPPKQQVMNWVMNRAEVRTLDMDLLIQRFFLQTEDYPEVSRSVRPFNPCPIDDAIKQYITINDHKETRRRKKIRDKELQEIQEQFQQQWQSIEKNSQAYK